MTSSDATRKFDPVPLLTKLKGKSYLEVRYRIQWLRTDHPDAIMETEMVQLDTEARLCVFRARVSIPGGGSATGWGQEEAKDFYDYIEKSETKALGRALAALGYGTQFCDDHTFGADDGRVVDSPVERPTTPPSRPPTPLQRAAEARGAQEVSRRPAQGPPPPPGRIPPAPEHVQGRPENRPILPATESQVKAIFAVGRGAQGMDSSAVEARCRELFGVATDALSRRQASEFIDALKGSA